MQETENRVDRGEKTVSVVPTYELQVFDSTGEKPSPAMFNKVSRVLGLNASDEPWQGTFDRLVDVPPLNEDIAKINLQLLTKAGIKAPLKASQQGPAQESSMDMSQSGVNASIVPLEETTRLHFSALPIKPLFYGKASTTVMCDKAGNSVGFIHLPQPVVTWRCIALIIFLMAVVVQFLMIQFVPELIGGVASHWWSFLSYPLMVILTPVFFKNEKTAVMYTSKKREAPYCTFILSSRFNFLLNTFKIEDKKGEIIGWLTKNRLNGQLQCYAANRTLLFTARRIVTEAISDKNTRTEKKRELFKIAIVLKKVWHKLSNREEANYVIKDDRGVKVGEFFSGQRCVLHIDEPFKKVRIDRRMAVPLALTMAGF